MKKSLSTFFLASFIATFGTASFADAVQMKAEVTKASGKVEVMKKGSWTPIKEGAELEKGDVIQTGFKSEAVLKIKGSTITIAPLSRVTLEQLVEKEGKDETRIFLDTGSLKSNVKKSEDRSVGFKVRSPVATASVRGTELSVTAKFRSTDIQTHSGTVAVWKTPASKAQIASESEDNAPAVMPGVGNTPKDIAGDGAPKTAFTVSRGQTAGFSSDGRTSTPQTRAADKAFGLRGSRSAGEAERESSAPAATAPARPGADGIKPEPTAKKGKIGITVEWSD